jgi:acyl-CoA hydrolase
MPELLTADEAAALVRDTDTLGIPLGPGQPGAFLHALGRRESFGQLTVFGALLVDLYEVFTRPGVRLLSGFFGPAERMLIDAGANIEFVPADFRRFGPIARAFSPRIVATAGAVADQNGQVSLSLHAGATVEELHLAGADPDRILVVETSPHFPRTFGLEPDHPHAVSLDEIDVLIESDRQPFLLEDPEPTAVDLAIAENVRRFITDGCTLQTGIGGVPSIVARLLAEGDGGDYGIHSEMFTTGLMHLHKAGKITNRKGIFDGFSVATFAAGTAELYEWLDNREEVRFLPVEYVNAPELIAANRRIVTLNGAISVDLYGQITADTVAGRQFSGIGGHEDFMAGPGLELEDRSLICLPSTASVDGDVISRIAGSFLAGAVVTTPRHQVDVVVTEHGVAELQGLTVKERSKALVAIAHPDFRSALKEQAVTLGI